MAAVGAWPAPCRQVFPGRWNLDEHDGACAGGGVRQRAWPRREVRLPLRARPPLEALRVCSEEAHSGRALGGAPGVVPVHQPMVPLPLMALSPPLVAAAAAVVLTTAAAAAAAGARRRRPHPTRPLVHRWTHGTDPTRWTRARGPTFHRVRCPQAMADGGGGGAGARSGEGPFCGHRRLRAARTAGA